MPNRNVKKIFLRIKEEQLAQTVLTFKILFRYELNLVIMRSGFTFLVMIDLLVSFVSKKVCSF